LASNCLNNWLKKIVKYLFIAGEHVALNIFFQITNLQDKNTKKERERFSPQFVYFYPKGFDLK